MKILQSNPELRQSLEQSLRKNNYLANRMKKVGVSPLRQRKIQSNNSILDSVPATSNEKVIEDLITGLNSNKSNRLGSNTSSNAVIPISKPVLEERQQPTIEEEMDPIQALLMNHNLNAVSPSKPMKHEKTRPRESVRNDLPDSENDDDEANIGEVRLPEKTGHFAQAPVQDNFEAPQEIDPIEMITNLLSQNKTAGREEIEQILQQHQRLSNISNNNS